MRPKIYTSFRPHGKWGDFLACIIPVTWCLNILTNSNFILRLIEWQNESSLFTIRVRAKQWYWVYKFELKNFTDILATPKNIGNNRWRLDTFGDVKTADDYLHALQLRSQTDWVKSYWSNVLKSPSQFKKNSLVSAVDLSKVSTDSNDTCVPRLSVAEDLVSDINTNAKFNKRFFTNDFESVFMYLNQKKELWGGVDENGYQFIGTEADYSDKFNQTLKQTLLNNRKAVFKDTSNIFNGFFQDSDTTVRGFSDILELGRNARRSFGTNSPVRLIKYPLGLDLTDDVRQGGVNNDLFRFRYGNGENKINHKLLPQSVYLTIKQKRYSVRNSIPSGVNHPVLKANSILDSSEYNQDSQYRMVMKSKTDAEMIPVPLAKRLLRVRRTLVLPAHVNITLITNSYDIIHSWFIPGLGIKIDCVPGRSTHHTFFIDNVGFYYGQCAEICGRYHHHMPIRVCALPFEHFLVW